MKKRGQPEKMPGARTRMYSVRLPEWMIERLKQEPGSQGKIIISALLKHWSS